MGKSLFVFGLGYSASALATTLLPQGWRVAGTSRDGVGKVDGCALYKWPGEDLKKALAQASHLLISIAPGEDGDPVLNAFSAELEALSKQFEWVGYLSTTGVYGDHQGGWVDEGTALTPATRRGELRVKAEADWQTLAARVGLPLHIFRLAGIYGPGRGPFAKVRRGKARRILKPGQLFSRIHVDDIAQVLTASITRPEPGAIYNVCDDLAAPPEDVLGFAAELLGLPQPKDEPYETAEMTPMARSFYAENKRVANDRIKAELGIKLIHPTYREGLQNLLALEQRK